MQERNRVLRSTIHTNVASALYTHEGREEREKGKTEEGGRRKLCLLGLHFLLFLIKVCVLKYIIH